MHGKISTASDEKMQRFRIKTARTYVEAIARQIGKNHGQAENIPYNAFPELQTKFFHKRCVILVISTKFQWISITKLCIFQTSGYKCRTISNEEKKLQVPSISSYAFSKCNETSPKVSLFLKRPAVQWCMEKIQLLPIEKMQKVPNQDS